MARAFSGKCLPRQNSPPLQFHRISPPSHQQRQKNASGESRAASIFSLRTPSGPGGRLLADCHRALRAEGACHLSRSDRKESSTVGSASIRSLSSMSRARGSILSGSSRENGSISKPGTWDRALAISLDRPGGESPVGREEAGTSIASKGHQTFWSVCR